MNSGRQLLAVITASLFGQFKYHPANWPRTRWIGIPPGFEGSIRFDEADRANLVLGLMIFAQYAWNVTYDLFLVPDHGRQFLWFDHEGALFVFFADPRRVEQFVSRMEAFGFALPTEPPSGFAWQPWMGPKQEQD